MAKKPRNRAAQDATLVNLRALKKRVGTLEARVWTLIAQMDVVIGLMQHAGRSPIKKLPA